MSRDHYDGWPFYCAFCGVGFSDVMACEETECCFESEPGAQSRHRRSEDAVMTELERARSHLLECQKHLAWKRVLMHYGNHSENWYGIVWSENMLLAALSWVWEAQNRIDGDYVNESA